MRHYRLVVFPLTAASDDSAILSFFHDVADAAADVLDENDDWSLSGERDGQYTADVLVDDAVVDMLTAAGVQILSEESGAARVTWPLETDDLLVIVDPLDGSSNAAKGIPWYATALCAVDRDGLRVALVAEQSGSEMRFSAIRGRGALCDGMPIRSSSCTKLSDAIVGFNGTPSGHGGWRQARVFGAAALDLCLVAKGGLDGYVDLFDHGVWDYAASLLICREAGCAIGEADGRELIHVNPEERCSPIVAANPRLLDALMSLRV